MTKLLSLILLFSIYASGCAQNLSQIEEQNERISVTRVFPKNYYEEDIHQLVNLLKENHPEPYQYISPDSLESLVNQKIAQLSDSTSIGDFVWLCRSVVSSIGCGHSTVPTLGNLINLPDSLLFPLRVKYIGSRLFVIDPLINDRAIKTGDEILSINGILVKDVKSRMSQHVFADAHNTSAKEFYINYDFMHYCAFQFGFTSNYEIEYKREDFDKKTRLNQLNTYSEPSTFLNNCENNLCFTIDEEKSLATIVIRSFSYYRENFPYFSSFIDSCFQEINSKQIKDLIIDLRNNGGGDPYCGSYLLQHIAKKPFQYYKTGTYAYPDLQVAIEPNTNRFRGRPYILINGRCFSTTGQLCALIKDHDLGIFIGKETGASYKCHASVRSFQLKKTGITPFIATRTFQANAERLPKDRGIIPDYIPETNLSNIIGNVDAEMELTLQLIANKK